MISLRSARRNLLNRLINSTTLQLKTIDVINHLRKYGMIVPTTFDNKRPNGKKQISLKQYLFGFLFWSAAIKLFSILRIDDASEWRYILGDYSPAFG